MIEKKIYMAVMITFLLVLATLMFASENGCFDGRPGYHFSPPKNWINDPNGLLYTNGLYHLFYQYNPFGDTWGHMSWGHAVSRDLLTWEHWPVAIPEDSVMIFSGSAVNDSLNTSGLGDENGCLVAIYTAHRSGHQAQALAYSTDKGRTWTHYSGNPILDRQMADFRDPKVFWYAPQKKWIMVVALPKLYKIAIYGSANLLDWELLSEFGPAGKAAGLWECPDLFELPISGRSKSKWILMLSSEGPHAGFGGMQYFVGDFDGTTFKNDNDSAQILYMDYGKDFYAGQTFNGLPTGRRILISWMNNWAYANQTPVKPFRGRMAVPRHLGLVETGTGSGLTQAPVTDLQNWEEVLTVENIIPNDLNSAISRLSTLKAYSLHLDILGSFSLAIKDADPFFVYDHNKKTVVINRGHNKNCFDHQAFAVADTTILSITKYQHQWDFYFDANSMEIFVGNGIYTFSNLVFPGAKLNQLCLHGEKPVQLAKIYGFLRE